LADPRIYTFAFKVVKICHLKWQCGCAHSQLNSVLNFDILLNVHLSIILVINQLNAQILVL